MRKIHGMVLVAVLAVVVAGCGKSDGTSPSSTSNGSNATAVAQDPATLEAPAAAAYEFLDAVRTGDDEKARRLLGTVAREKTASMNRNVTPPASDTARFTVGKIDYVGEDGARVLSTWTDLDDQQQPTSETYVWVLRREPEGWRVVGLAAQIFPDRDPVVLNFEDPEDMARQQQWVREEIRRRKDQETGQAPRQAQEPGNQEKQIIR